MKLSLASVIRDTAVFHPFMRHQGLGM